MSRLDAPWRDGRRRQQAGGDADGAGVGGAVPRGGGAVAAGAAVLRAVCGESGENSGERVGEVGLLSGVVVEDGVERSSEWEDMGVFVAGGLHGGGVCVSGSACVLL